MDWWVVVWFWSWSCYDNNDDGCTEQDNQDDDDYLLENN